MQRQIIFILICTSLFFFGITLSSCTKCVKCEEFKKGTVSGNPDYDFPEVCGDDAKMLEYQTYREDNVDPGNELKCTSR